METYPETDFPWTLYFQGIEMPKWSNCWQWQPVADSDVDWYVDQVHGRMDHVECIESEESEVFIIAAQQTFLGLIDNKDSFASYPETTPEKNKEIYQCLISGVQQMISIAEQNDVVFWTSGYESDQNTVRRVIERFKLGPSHPDYFEPPHRARRRRERLFSLNWQRKELRRRLDNIGPNKALKTFIHNLKDKKG